MVDESGVPLAGAEVIVIGIPAHDDGQLAHKQPARGIDSREILATCVTGMDGRWTVAPSILDAAMLKIVVGGLPNYWDNYYYIEDTKPSCDDAELAAITLLLTDVRQGRPVLRLRRILEWLPVCVVLSEDGTVVSDAEVAVGSGTFAWPEIRGVTDRHGRFQADKSVRVQEKGDAITVSVRAPGFDAAQKQVVLTDADTMQQVAVFHLVPGREITGHVRDESGKPLADSSVLIVDRRHKCPIQSWMVTDSEGRFHATGLPESGRLLVVAAANSEEFRHSAEEVLVERVARRAMNIVLKRLSVAALRVDADSRKETAAWLAEKCPDGPAPAWHIAPEQEGAPTEMVFVTRQLANDGGIPGALSSAFFRIEGDPEEYVLLHYNTHGGESHVIQLDDIVRGTAWTRLRSRFGF